MGRTANIAIVTFIYAATCVAAFLLIYGPDAPLSADVAKWLWSPAVLILGSLTTLAWKIHETKRVEGLKAREREKLRRISGLIQKRLLVIGIISALGALLGLMAAYVRDPFAAPAVTLAFSAVVGSLILTLGVYPATQRDVQDFEDAAREKLARASAIKSLNERLEDEPPADSKPDASRDSKSNKKS